MQRVCDVCGSKVSPDERFCNGCGLELADEPPATAALQEAPASEGAPRVPAPVGDYTLAALETDTALLRNHLERAETLLEQGHLTECADLLGACGRMLGADRPTRAAYARVAAGLKSAKAKALRRVETLQRAPEQLLAYLAGPAGEQLTQNEIARLAIAHARSLCESGDAATARGLLQLGVFRRVRDPQLVAEHRELDNLVWRRQQRQHWLRSSAIFAVAIPLSLVLLVLWVKLLLLLPGRLSVVVAVAALAALIWGVEPLRRWLHRKLDGKPREDVEN